VELTNIKNPHINITIFFIFFSIKLMMEQMKLKTLTTWDNRLLM
jgi:hypothetical protein